MVENSETYRLAQLALSEARDAKHMAEIGNLTMSSHEKICSERYEKINNTLNTIPTLLLAINEIKVEQAKALSLNKAIAYVAGAVGLIYTIMKVTGQA